MNSSTPETVCTRCVMDSTAASLKFDEDGVCDFCHEYETVRATLAENVKNSDQYFEELKRKLKADQKGPYDCIIGLSGGVDSSYVALMAKRLELQPLLVHFDNGWNSEIAVQNIKKISNVCGYDLETYVIDWNEFRDLQRSFLKASVVDIEMLTDHAITATMFKLARQRRVKNLISGSNGATEYGLPRDWIWNKFDWVNIKAIHALYGEKKLKTFPRMPTWRYIATRRLGLGFDYHSILDHLPYRKEGAMKELQAEFDWQYYGGKHYESVFTKFYQAHILPQKFKIDKRKAHLSALIRNNEITREEALAELGKPIYPPDELEDDLAFVCKKLGFSEQEFSEIMQQERKSHAEYGTDETHFEVVLGIYHKLRGLVGLKKKNRNKALISG